MQLACVDIDQTMVGTPKQQLGARQALEQAGYKIAFVTSRTSETLISWSARAKSTARVNARPKATQYGDPAHYSAFSGLVDAPYIAATTGVELLKRRTDGGYQFDATWWHQLKSFGSSEEWYAVCQSLIIDGVTIQTPSDVAAPWYRLQLTAQRPAALKRLIRCLPSTIDWADESIPAKHYYSIYLLPHGVNKQTVVDRIIAIERKVNALLMIGDSQTDYPMGFQAGQGLPATFLMVGGARLPKLLPAAIKRQLKRTRQRGWYRFQDRTIIIGDEAFPHTKGPVTIQRYLATL